LRYHQKFVGSYWRQDWLDGWELIYKRPAGKQGDIINEFEAVYDGLENVWEWLLSPLRNGDYETAPRKLAVAYNGPEVVDFRIYHIDDNDILRGRLVLGYRAC